MKLNQQVEAAVKQGVLVPELVELIRTNGVSLQAESARLLLLAARTSRTDIVVWLLEEPSITVSPFEVDSNGRTILHIAVGRGDKQLVSTLLGNDQIDQWKLQMIASGNGMTALELAVDLKHHDIIWSFVRNFERIPLHDKDFRARWKRLVDSATDEVKSILHLPWREYQLNEMWQTYDKKVNKRALEVKLRACRWWPLSVHDAPWNDRERARLSLALKKAASTRDEEIVRWLVEEWNVDLRDGDRSWKKFLSLCDCAAHERISWEEENDEQQYFCRIFLAKAIDRWDCKQLADLVKEYRAELETFRKANHAKFPGVVPDVIDRLLEEAIRSLQDSDHAEESADFRPVLDFLVRRFGRGAVPRLDLLAIYGKVAVLQHLVGKGLVNLREPIVVLSQGQQPAASEEDKGPDSVPKEECAVCLEELFTSVSFPCGHVFCQQCSVRLRGEDQAREGGHTRCPMCRAPLPALNADIEKLLYSHMAVSCPRLVDLLGPGLSLGDVLMLIAAHSGSLGIMEWLARVGVSLATKVKGKTLMHVAAMREQYAVVRWLAVARAHQDMASAFCEEGRLPMHEAALHGDQHTLLFLVQLEGHGGLRADREGNSLVSYCIRSGNSEMKQQGEGWGRMQALEEDLPALLNSDAPLAQIAAVLKERGVLESMKDLFNQRRRGYTLKFMALICKKGRSDVLKWVYANAKEQWIHYLANPLGKDGEGGSKLLRFGVEEARGASASGEGEGDVLGIAVVMRDVAKAQKASRDCLEQFTEFQDKWQSGAQVEELQRVIETQEAIVAEIDPEFHHFFGFRRIGLAKNEHPDQTKVMLCVAADSGHRHLVKWLLADAAAAAALDDAAVVEALVKSMPKGHGTVRDLFVEATARGYDLNKIPFKLFQPWGAALVASPHWDAGVSVTTLAVHCIVVAENAETRARCLDTLRWLAECPGLEWNAPLPCDGEASALGMMANSMLRNEKGEPDLEEVEHSTNEDILEVLLKAGVDFHANPSSDLQIFAQIGKMGLVRKLAIDHGVNVQGMDPDWALLKKKLKPERAVAKIKKWKKIKAQQGAMFNLADDILRGAVDLDPASLEGINLASLRDRHGRLLLEGARADSCAQALAWLADKGIS